IKSTKNDFEDVQQAVYRKMDDVYRQTIFKTEFQLSSGAISLGKAIDKATEDFLAKGVNCIAYKDKNGEIMRYVNIADYAEMALRTASHRATLLGEGSKRDELGVHLVFVSAHANSCKLCLPWQGQILIDDVFSHPSKAYIARYKDKYKHLSDAVKAGLLHPNCRHTLATYFEGVTRLPKPQDPKIALENYNYEQRQRKLE
ncbi:phage minor capsid protein, partial [[Clostridium] innocuum]|nr:phage minor capsid protein [[Clostridium] innocuum]